MNENTSIVASFRIQKQVIYALLNREIITRYGRQNIGFLWLFIEPVIFTTIITIAWSFITSYKSNVLVTGFPITMFVMTGWTAGRLWMSTTNRVISSIESNTGLLYHQRIKPFDIVISRIILEVAGFSGAFIIVSTFFIFIGWVQPIKNYWYIILGWYGMVWFTICISIFIFAMDILTIIVRKIWPVISLLLFVSSGTFYTVSMLPDEAKNYALLLPTVHLLEMMRFGFNNTMTTFYFDIWYVVIFNSFFLFFALFLQKIAVQKVKNKIGEE